MTEYARVSASTYDLDSLVHQLNERAADGWDVVSIVPTGADVTAILKRATKAAEDALPPEYAHLEPVAEAEPSAPEPEVPPVMAEVAAEPSGWAVAPEPAPQVVEVTPPPAAEPTPVATVPEPAAAPAPAIVTPAPAPAIVTPAPAATTPAGWYPDPSGRFELRYWDGTQWSEHVSRAGQQFTDPPVA